MSGAFSIDEDLVRRLPLPLAHLHRRAANAKTALERHLSAYYLWEATLKLTAAVAVVAYAQANTPDVETDGRLATLTRASVGQWWEIIRRLTTLLGDRGDPKFKVNKEFLLGRSRDDLPRCAGLDSALREALEGSSTARSTVRISELLDRLIQYRNREVGHGAAGGRRDDFYEKMARALHLGGADLLGRFDLLCGRRMIFISDVYREPAGSWALENFDLIGESARRLEPIRIPAGAGDNLPNPGHIYLVDADSTQFWSMDPFLAFDAEIEEVLFFNARRGKRLEYLSYGTGKTLEKPAVLDTRAVIAAIFGGEESTVDAPAAAEAAAPVEDAEESGRTIGEFELLSLLGKGGMGVVYRAYQPSLGRQVALKCLLRSDDPKAESRFTREIHALGRVEHPNLVKIFTSGAAGDQWFYAMELVEGTSLSAVCDSLVARRSAAGDLDLATWQNTYSQMAEEARKSEKVISKTELDETTKPAEPVATDSQASHEASRATAAAAELAALGHRSYIRHVVSLIRQITLATHTLNEAQVVHRDIKPGNIMLTSGGTHAVLMDLGLAQIADEGDSKLTRTRQFVGTLRYASPEQVLAVGNLDRRSDVYSIGATLWEMLTLHPLYDAGDDVPTPEVMRRVQYQEPDRPRKYHPGIPRDLEAITLKCLEKDRNRRYPTAQELADDLQRWLDDEPVRAQPPTVTYVLGKFVRKRWLPLSAAAALLLLLAVGAVLAVRQIAKARDIAVASEADARKSEADAQAAAARAVASEKKALDAKADALEKQQEAQHMEYLSQIRLAYEAWKQDEIGRASSILNILDYNRPEKNPGWEWNYLQGLMRSGLVSLVGHTDLVCCCAFNPTGDKLVSGSSDCSAIIWDVATGREIRRLGYHLDGPMIGINYRLDDVGAYVAEVFPGSSAEESGILPGDYITRIMSTDQKWVDVAGLDLEQVGKLIGVPEGTDLRLELKTPAGATRQVIVTRRHLTINTLHDNAIFAVTFSPDQSMVATASRDGTVKLWNASDGSPIRTLTGPKEIKLGCHVQFSPDGQQVAVIDGDGTILIWSLDGTLVRKIPMPGESCAISNDWKWIATAQDGQNVFLYDLASGQQMYRLTCDDGHALPAAFCQFSSDSRFLAIGGNDGEFCIWDLTAPPTSVATSRGSESQLKSIWTVRNAHQQWIDGFSFSPDDSELASCSYDGMLKLWDLHKYKFIVDHSGHSGAVTAVAFSPQSTRIATASCDQTVLLWDVSAWGWAGNRDSMVLGDGALPDSDQASGINLSADGRKVCLNTWGEGMMVWDTAGNRSIVSNPGWIGTTIGCINPQDADLCCIDTPAHKLQTVRFSTDKVVTQFTDVPDETLRWLQFSPDGTLLAGATDIGDDHTVRVWDVATGKLVSHFDQHMSSVAQFCFMNDGKQIASVCVTESVVRLWDVMTGKETTELQSRRPFCVAESPDSTKLAVGNFEGSVFLYTLKDGSYYELKGHFSEVKDVSFSPDSSRLASCSDDGTIKIWDATTGQEVLTLAGGEGGVVSVRFMPDGLQLISCDADGRMRLWNAGLMAADKPLSPALLAERAVLSAGIDEWQDSLNDLDDAINLGFNETWAYQDRGIAHAVLQQYDQAYKDLNHAIDAGLDENSANYMSAILDLNANDLPGYRARCATLLKENADDKTPEMQYRESWICKLGPDAVADLTVPAQLAQSVVAARPGDYNAASNFASLLYRQGKYQAAIDAQTAAMKLYTEEASDSSQFLAADTSATTRPEGAGTAWDYVFLAMANKKLGHDGDARNWLEKARLWIAANKPTVPRASHESNLNNEWFNQLSLAILYREASGIVNTDQSN
jgi:WD40 repeat protein/serine/threonine protein kinase